MRYRDRSGCRCLESTHTEDWQDAQRQLRERLYTRDNNTLATVRKGEQLTFDEWADFFVENYSKPPIRAEKTHEANENALKTLRPVFGPMKLGEIDATGIEMPPPTPPQAAQTRAAEIGSDRTRTAEAGDGPSGVSSASADSQRRSKEEALPGEPVCRCRVPRDSEGTVPATLRDGVGTADD
jgi:hypothetical protein